MVAIDYFTNWTEVEPLATITEAKITNLICRFGIPHAIISDNEKQFDNPKFNHFCAQLIIKHFSSSPTHLQANVQVEAINKFIKRGLKLRLEDRKGRWAEELLEVLWSYRTTTQKSTGETLFALAFGSEAVVPI